MKVWHRQGWPGVNQGGGMRTRKVLLPKGRFLRYSQDYLDAINVRLFLQPEILSYRCAERRIDVYLGKPNDIPLLLATGVFDCGLSPGEWRRESEYGRLATVVPTRLMPVRFALFHYLPEKYSGQRVVTCFPTLARECIDAAYGLQPEIFAVSGSVETYVPLISNFGIDIVETGDTLRRNGLTATRVFAEFHLELMFRAKCIDDLIPKPLVAKYVAGD